MASQSLDELQANMLKALDAEIATLSENLDKLQQFRAAMPLLGSNGVTRRRKQGKVRKATKKTLPTPRKKGKGSKRSPALPLAAGPANPFYDFDRQVLQTLSNDPLPIKDLTIKARPLIGGALGKSASLGVRVRHALTRLKQAGEARAVSGNWVRA